jgi:hypothetical protein
MHTESPALALASPLQHDVYNAGVKDVVEDVLQVPGMARITAMLPSVWQTQQVLHWDAERDYQNKLSDKYVHSMCLPCFCNARATMAQSLPMARQVILRVATSELELYH